MKVDKNIITPLLIALFLIVVFIIVSSSITSVLFFIPLTFLSFLVYLKTFYKKTPKPNKLLPLYLLALGIQFIHFTEEYLTGFTIELPQLSSQAPYPTDYWLIFNMLAYFIFLMGGIIIFKQIKSLMIIPLFFIIVGVIFNPLAHILLSIYVRNYFPGLYTSIVYVILAPVIVKTIWKETRS